MRILMLSWEYPPYVVGGLGRHVAELSPALARQGIEVHVVTPTAKNDEVGISIEDSITVHRVFAPEMAAMTPDIYQRAVGTNKIMADYAKQAQIVVGKFDLIHAHDWLTGFAGEVLQTAWGTPLVITIHATERGRVRGYLAGHLQWAIDGAEHKLIREAQRVIVCSRYMYHELQNLFQTPADKLEVISNAVMLEDVRNGLNPHELAALRAKFAAPGDKVIFTISRLVYEKGVHQLVQAAPRVLSEFPEARIIIAGRGPEAEYLKQQAIDLKVADRVNFVGFITDEERNHLFRTAACAIFPSLYEPFGIVALEAMAVMCPVIVSDVGGFSEMVKHLETGITVYPDDSGSIAWGILHTLNHPDRAREYALKAYQSVETLFNWPRIARLTIDVYQRVLEKQAVSSINLQST